MKKLLLFSLIISLFNCRPGTNVPIAPIQPVQPIPSVSTPPQTTTAGFVGRYLVTAYIVAGDTLHTARRGFPIKSKLDIDNFAIVISNTGNGQYTITYSYYHNPTGEVPTFTKKVTAKVLNDYYYRFTDVNAQPGSISDSKLYRTDNEFYQRSVGGSISIPLKNSLVPLDQTTDEEVIIVAVPQNK